VRRISALVCPAGAWACTVKLRQNNSPETQIVGIRLEMITLTPDGLADRQARARRRLSLPLNEAGLENLAGHAWGKAWRHLHCGSFLHFRLRISRAHSSY